MGMALETHLEVLSPANAGGLRPLVMGAVA